MRKWRKTFKQRINNKNNSNLSMSLYQTNVMQTTWNYWMRHYKHSVWLKVTSWRSKEFRSVNLQRTFFLHWKRKRSDWKEIYTNNYTRPIGYWGYVLLKKGFLKWLTVVQEGKRLAKEIGQAKEWHSSQLISLSLTQLMTVSSSIEFLEVETKLFALSLLMKDAKRGC